MTSNDLMYFYVCFLRPSMVSLNDGGPTCYGEVVAFHLVLATLRNGADRDDGQTTRFR